MNPRKDWQEERYNGAAGKERFSHEKCHHVIFLKGSKRGGAIKGGEKVVWGKSGALR